MNNWQEFNQHVLAWRQAGDQERLRLASLYHEALRYRETDPEYQFALLTQARDEARRLNEPWWTVFFESWRLTTLACDLHDFTRAHPLAMELMVRLTSPEYQGHSDEVAIQTNVLYTYLTVDPLGHRDDLERGFAHLDQHISKGPVSDRFVHSYRWIEYLCETLRWQEALERAQEFQALVDCGGRSAWWRCWVLFLLCRICDALGLVDELALYAEDMAKQSENGESLVRTRASGLIWRAVAHRIRGEERAASPNFHDGLRCLKTLSSRDEICADAKARYYELANDWQAAAGIRDRELQAIAKKGMLHRECVLHLERCRLLGRAGTVTSADMGEARNAAAKMREPDWYLRKLVELG